MFPYSLRRDTLNLVCLFIETRRRTGRVRTLEKTALVKAFPVAWKIGMLKECH
jgi:hypothetical protein